MPKLSPADWITLRDEYKVAFSGMDQRLFDLLLNKLYSPETSTNPGGSSGNPNEVDAIDALMFYCAHAEPPIPPPPVK